VHRFRMRTGWFWACGLSCCLVLVGCGNQDAAEDASATQPPVEQLADGVFEGGDDVETRFPTPLFRVSPELSERFPLFCAERIEGLEAGAMAGLDGWLYLKSELRFCSQGGFWGGPGDGEDPLPAIQDFAEQLRSRGVELWLVPVPAKAAVYPEGLDAGLALGAGERLDRTMVAFLKELGGRGLQVVDLMEPFLRAKAEGGPALYCKTDSHWSGYACELTAAILAEELKTVPGVQPDSRRALETEERVVEVRGDLGGMLGDAGFTAGSEQLPLRTVTESGAPVAPDPASPVLVLGDSHTLVFHAGGDMHAVGSGLVDQLAYELGTAVDLIGVRGSGATPARISLMRRMRTDPEYLAGKRVVIWCLSAREFTEADGWRKVPLP
jgi:hypothetical protein